jgi:hypothetical protein
MDTPAYLIDVVPQLKVDGHIVVQGDPVGAGLTCKLDMAYIQPGKDADLFEHDVVMGSYNGLDICLGKVPEKFLNIARVEDDGQPYMAKLAHSLAAKYHHEENLTRELINATMRLKSSTFFSEALVSTYQNRRFVFGVPQLGRLSGFTIDAKSKESSVEPLDGQNRKKVNDFIPGSTVIVTRKRENDKISIRYRLNEIQRSAYEIMRPNRLSGHVWET